MGVYGIEPFSQRREGYSLARFPHTEHPLTDDRIAKERGLYPIGDPGN